MKLVPAIKHCGTWLESRTQLFHGEVFSEQAEFSPTPHLHLHFRHELHLHISLFNSILLHPNTSPQLVLLILTRTTKLHRLRHLESLTQITKGTPPLASRSSNPPAALGRDPKCSPLSIFEGCGCARGQMRARVRVRDVLGEARGEEVGKWWEGGK
ncbi:hypothetical protein K402DRAFT_105712 [Aulographum hederae CBS 113979]|uniref:Uncharacterized protein n=1 Tax=Aulographum hederae CBS 113979 TaxID=1176131 RepID=A0A6G1GY60_9PEZI|nr:hypothetical protein K402DRAFT_105712 [Aulographum hederae CBS 113979]